MPTATRTARYRVIISAALEGTPLEGFRYEGTAPDDPNDIVPHENRRELRGLRVFGAWVNHTDAKAINSMDTLVNENGRSIVRHHLLDFNATLGSAGIGLRERRDGYEYLAEFGPTWKALPSFGFYVRPWMTVDYPELSRDRPVRGEALRAGAVAPARAEPRLRPVAPRRHVLGGAQADGDVGRPDSRRGAGGALHRTRARNSSSATP